MLPFVWRFFLIGFPIFDIGVEVQIRGIR